MAKDIKLNQIDQYFHLCCLGEDLVILLLRIKKKVKGKERGVHLHTCNVGCLSSQIRLEPILGILSPLNPNLLVSGFGSMLRALGAQIEKTTNREACRDLSGRRLRDVNHEKA